MNYALSLLSQVSIFFILSLSFNFSLGFSGLINLGHIAFFGLGAYTSAILYVSAAPFFPSLGVLLILVILCAGFLSAIVSLALIGLCRKLEGDYLALATLGFHFVVYSLFLNLEELTGGTRGIILSRPEFLKSHVSYFIFILIISSLFFYFLQRIANSPFGTALGALRDDEQLFRSIGKNSFIMKVKAIAVSSFAAGSMGALFAFYLKFVHPDLFFLPALVIILSIVIMGGLASVKGTLIAAFIVSLLPSAIRFLPISSTIVGPMQQLLYAAVIIAILLFKPRGFYGRVDLK